MSDSSSSSESSAEQKLDVEEKKNAVFQERLGKKLAYLLRYGAEKEGLTVTERGFVSVDDLLKTNILGRYQKEQILSVAKDSTSMRAVKRFEVLEEPHLPVLIRATYGRRLERNPNHDGCSVERLMVSSLRCVAQNVKRYRWSEVADDYILNLILRHMKRHGTLTSRSLKELLVPALDHLDLADVLVSDGVLKAVALNCRWLKTLSLRDCGYAITDHSLAILLKNLPELESLNLCGCNHLTGESLQAITKRCPKIRHLNLTFVCNIRQESLLQLIEGCPNLEEINFYDFADINEVFANRIREITRSRNLFRLEICNGMVITPGVTTNVNAIYDSAWERPNYR